MRLKFDDYVLDVARREIWRGSEPVAVEPQVIGASAVVQQASRRGAPKGSWLAQMLARKPKMLVTVALANKMARIIWALLVKGGTYRTPTAAA